MYRSGSSLPCRQQDNITSICTQEHVLPGIHGWRCYLPAPPMQAQYLHLTCLPTLPTSTDLHLIRVPAVGAVRSAAAGAVDAEQVCALSDHENSERARAAIASASVD